LDVLPSEGEGGEGERRGYTKKGKGRKRARKGEGGKKKRKEKGGPPLQRLTVKCAVPFFLRRVALANRSSRQERRGEKREERRAHYKEKERGSAPTVGVPAVSPVPSKICFYPTRRKDRQKKEGRGEFGGKRGTEARLLPIRGQFRVRLLSALLESGKCTEGRKAIQKRGKGKKISDTFANLAILVPEHHPIFYSFQLAV